MELLKELSPVVSLCVAVFGMYFAYETGLKKESYKIGEDRATLLTDLKYIKERLDNFLVEQKLMAEKQEKHYERLIKAEESAKQAHKRLDHMEKEVGK